MKKWKDIPRNEKMMILLIVLLLIGIVLRRTAVKEGISRGFNWFGGDQTEEVVPADSLAPVDIVLPDAAPDEQPDVLRLEMDVRGNH